MDFGSTCSEGEAGVVGEVAAAAVMGWERFSRVEQRGHEISLLFEVEVLLPCAE